MRRPTILPRDSDLNSWPGRIVLVLQGGGALGSYQAGVYQALHEGGIDAGWVMKSDCRTEKDSMGEMQVPVQAYYGAQAARAKENFACPIQSLRIREAWSMWATERMLVCRFLMLRETSVRSGRMLGILTGSA